MSAQAQDAAEAQELPATPAVVSQTEPSNVKDEAQSIPAAIVIEVSGSVQRAESGVSPLASEGWAHIVVGDRLEPGTQIRTGLRSHVNFRFGETTVVSVRSATHASIDQFYESATTERVRIGLAYGTVRGGSSEGPIESDVTVESTVATLAKRGTEGWQMWVEGMSGRFKVSLAKHGLVEAIQKLADGRQVSRLVRPGEYATHNNIANMWINQDIFDRNVQFYHADSITVADTEFTRDNPRGFGVLSPGGGLELVALSGKANAGDRSTLATNLFTAGSTIPATVVFVPDAVDRPEGNFGAGRSFRVLIPSVLKHGPLSRVRGPRAVRAIGSKDR